MIEDSLTLLLVIWQIRFLDLQRHVIACRCNIVLHIWDFSESNLMDCKMVTPLTPADLRVTSDKSYPELESTPSMCKPCVYAETVIHLCAEYAHRMSTSDDPRRVHFQSPEYLVDRLDAIADLFDKDRTDLLVEAIREYIEETADSETFQELVATKYYDGQLEFETVKQLVGAETAQRLRLLKADLEDEPLNIDAPDDVDVYDGDATTVDTVDDDR